MRNVDNEGESESLTLRFEQEEGLQEVPAMVLSKVIEATQQVVYILAHQEEGIALPPVGRFQRDLEKNYLLLCSPLQPGSVVVPMRFAPSEALPNQQDVVNLLAHVSEAVANNDERELAKIVPDSLTRRRVLNNINDMVPASNTGISASLIGPRELRLPLSEATRRTVARMRRASPPSSDSTANPTLESTSNPMVVTGELTRIDFAQRTLTLKYPVTGQEIDCVYPNSVEEDLFAQRRDLIQVTGNVVLDADDNPVQITDVEDVRPLDLSPIELNEFVDEEAGVMLRFREPITLTPTSDETKQLLLLDYDPLNIHTFAMTREELEDVLFGLIWVKWDDLAKTADDRLLPSAKRLKALLLKTIEEVTVAA